MEKNFLDQLSDSYDKFHLEDSEIKKGEQTIVISSKLKLILGWSVFVLIFILCCVLTGVPFGKKPVKEISSEKKQSVLDEDVDVGEEHDTMIPYEKDANEELIDFVKEYFDAIVKCDNVALQDMVFNPKEFKNDQALLKKAEYITGYDNITVYTKAGLEDESYVTFVVSNVNILGVNSAPYDIVTLYIVNGERGFMINNGMFSVDTEKYIEKVKGDEDIQKIYRSIEKKNNKLKESDQSLRDFYDIISRRNVDTNSAADLIAPSGVDQSAKPAPQEETVEEAVEGDGGEQAE